MQFLNEETDKRIVETYTDLDTLKFTDSASLADLIAAITSNIYKITASVPYRK